MKGTSTLQRRSEVSARFHLVQKLFRSSPFFTKRLTILTIWFSRLVRVSPCAEEISCIATWAHVQKARFANNVLARSASPVRARNSRHCHATLLDAAGAPLGTVQALLGHASPEVTRQIYLHAMPAEQRRAVEGVEKLEEVAQRPN
jgi:integrase